MPLPFHEFGASSRADEKKIIKELKAIVRADHIGQHMQAVGQFETEIASFLKVKYTIGLASGTDALAFAIRLIMSTTANQNKKNAEVITVANTWLTTITAIEESGARVKYIDIDKATGLMDLDQLEGAINDNTVAIVPVHMYGQMVRMDKLMNIAQQYKLSVVEDACQAIGASCDSKPAGSWGDMGCFSFFTTKLVGAPGDGGLLVTNNESWNDKIRQWRVANWDNQDLQSRVPSRLSPLQVPFLKTKLAKLELRLNLRAQQMDYYRNAFASCEHAYLLQPPSGTQAANRNCILVTEKREQVMQALKAKRFPCELMYPNSEKLLAQLATDDVILPNTQYLMDNHVSLPLGMHMSQKKQNAIIGIVKKAIQS